MISVKFRVLTAEDTAAYCKVRLEALERDPTAFGSSMEDHRKLSESDLRSRISKDPANNFVIGVFAGGELVGTAGFVRDTGVKVRHKGKIWGVYLRAELRGQGAGRRMLQMVVERAAKIQGLEQILINVTTTQAAAIAIYRSVGFTSFGVEPKALKIGDLYIDEEYMVLRLARKADPSSG